MKRVNINIIIQYMKKFLLLLIITSLTIKFSYSQQINGVILSDTANITIVKLWGTHEERGFAYGYLLGEKITNIVEDYVIPLFGIYLSAARNIIIEEHDLVIDSIYKEEAAAIVAGMDSAGTNQADIDYIDVLVFNSFLDIAKLLGVTFSNSPMGCSGLMDWGDATSGTDLDGKSVISRHLDWDPASALVSNQIMAIHIPSEADEQPWLLIGFAGHIFALSGLNESGLSAFMNVLSDFYGNAQHNKAYEPIWLTIRKFLESTDFNNDGTNNTQDMRDAVNINSNGYADGFIISSLAPSTETYDSLIALVAELAPQAPHLTFRSNSYEDIIPGDNLYAANWEIKRNNHHHYCTRYYAISYAIGDGINISSTENWNLMKNYSNAGLGNIQFMQVIPEFQILKLSIHRNGVPAYLNNPVYYDLNYLFSPITDITEKSQFINSINIYPNPATTSIYLEYDFSSENPEYFIYDLQGKLIESGKLNINFSSQINISNIDDGVYVLKVLDGNKTDRVKFVKQAH